MVRLKRNCGCLAARKWRTVVIMCVAPTRWLRSTMMRKTRETVNRAADFHATFRDRGESWKMHFDAWGPSSSDFCRS